MAFEVNDASFVSKLAEQGAVLLDVRSPAEFRQVHVAGAINLPLEKVSEAAVKKILQDKVSSVVVLLCAAGTRARKAAEQLEATDLKLVVITGGTNACLQLNIPVIRGETKTISIERQVRISAGAIVFIGVVLGYFVHPAFYAVSGFIGAGLMFAGITDWCGMGLLLAKAPWNK
jgi:rhodanese-related sulfurtransferase